EFAAQITGRQVSIDLGGVRRVNSLGVRRWIEFVRALQGKTVSLTRCSPAVVELLNSIHEFKGHATIQSILLPYSCEQCGAVSYDEMAIGPTSKASDLQVNGTCKS